MKVGEYIKSVRKEKGLTLREAAKLCGVSHPYLSQLETGKNNNPTAQVIEKIAKGLKIPNGTLLLMSGHITDPFDYSYQNSKEAKLIDKTAIDLRFILKLKEEAYYNGKPLTDEQRKRAVAVLDALFME